MRKIAMLITSVLLFASILCIVPASESDAVTAEAENVLIYEVYKVDISAVSVSLFSNVMNVIYFNTDDLTGKHEFEEALRNREPLPSGLSVTWDGHTTHDLTAYVFGPPVTMSYFGDHSDTKFRLNGSDWKYILDKDWLDGASSTNIIGGQTVKVTISDAPDHVPLVLHSSSYSVELEESESQVEIGVRGDYAIYGRSWTSSPYISYTIEYEGLPPEVFVYGYAFLATGILSLGIMVWFSRPQRIKD